MKKIKLYGNKCALIDNEDFDYINQWKWSLSNTGYACRQVNQKKTILMHRVINKTPEGKQTDHINRNRLDNRRANLRSVTVSQNQLNVGLRKDNTSGFRGVYLLKNKKAPNWFAKIQINKKSVFFGYFHTAKEAYNTIKEYQHA